MFVKDWHLFYWISVVNIILAVAVRRCRNNHIACWHRFYKNSIKREKWMEWTVTFFCLYFICTFDVNVILIVIVIMIENTFCLVNHHSMKIPITVKYFLSHLSLYVWWKNIIIIYMTEERRHICLDYKEYLSTLCWLVI